MGNRYTDKDIAEEIRKLWQSLRRAGNHFSEEVDLSESNGFWVVTMPLQDELPKDSRKYITAYVREFLSAFRPVLRLDRRRLVVAIKQDKSFE